MEIINMKKILYTTLCVAGMFAATSCEDYLEVSSPSVVDSDFVFSNPVTARAALDGAYEQWRDCAQNKVFGDGLFYAADVAGSDIERHPEAFSNQLGRHYPEGFYQNGKYAGEYGLTSYLKENDIYASLYAVVSKANAVITSMENAANFEEIINGGQSKMGQMYGEAVAIRATAYRELCKNFGDVPYVGVYGDIPVGLVSRDSIYDICIADLQKVEGLMYPVGKIPDIPATNKNYFSQTYVQGLIGRMCLDAAGYQTRRGDIKRVDGKGNALTFETKGNENNGAAYGRRNDWKELYSIAKTYYEKLLANSGSAQFHLTDPRGEADNSGRTFGNPYQYFFEQMHQADAIYADESIYEYPMQQGGGNDGRSYSFGRPSSGGSKNAYPCKAYGQGRINPAYFYGIFDPNDMRRDVSITMTGSTGKGTEKLISFTPNSKAEGGGLSLNKWDENRQANVWVAAQRKSGINGPYMRMAEIYLGYAEVCAALGDQSTAKQYLKTVRERSFPAGMAKTDEFIAACGNDLVKAVVEERGFEFAGEGDRRWTLIRSGYLPEALRRIKTLTADMMDGLAANGYYEFENGNVISSYVWTKLVDAKTSHGHRLTAQCPVGKEDDPVLYPGWRGQNDSWESYKSDLYSSSTPATNLAIKGLFKPVTAEEAAALEADGYAKEDWGVDLLAARDEYDKYLFWDYDYVSAPIYLWPFTPNVMAAGGFTNGYGFKQQ
ncbi:MAG: RagB/SusD family nutrient uptake outer membrane protein [Bacteroides sp.]|nr:RagB/SusD family nutrient uptake outer membrane protein [Bacteroides sp.]